MPAQLVPFLVFVIMLTIVPGPDTALGLRNSLRGGSTAMWWTGLGCCTGLLVHAVISVAGLSALLAASTVAYTGLKTAGAVYLVWLGASALRKSFQYQPPEFDDFSERPESSGLARSAAFGQGLISNLLNPKIIVLFMTLLPQFISHEEPRVGTSIVLSLVFLGVALVWWRVTSWLIGYFRRMLTRRRVRLTLERLSGGALVAIGLRLAVATP